jgi:LEA14-like dessication related protein
MLAAFALRRRTWLILVAALGLTVACAKPKPPTITPKSVQLRAVGPSGVQLAVTLEVANPNRFPLVARAVDGRFLLAASGAEVGTAHTLLASSIPAEGIATVVSDLAVSWTDLVALAPFMLSPAPVPYRFEGHASLGGESLNVSVPFTLTGELTRAQLLTAGLGGMSPPAP